MLLFFKQKTAYEMRISDWSSDVCYSDLIMVYASFGRGSKSGGFVSNTYNVAADGFQFKPERSTNYEAGIKSTLAGGKATINLTIFRTEFDNLQQSDRKSTRLNSSH